MVAFGYLPQNSGRFQGPMNDGFARTLTAMGVT